MKKNSNEQWLKIYDIIGCKKRGIPPLIPVCKTTWWKWVKLGIAPKPYRICGRNYWLKSKIDEFKMGEIMY